MALSWSIDVSVISRTICDGSTPASRMMASTSSTNSGWTSCRAEMLTLTVNGCRPRGAPRAQLPARLAEDPAADLEDRVGLLGDPDEVVRADPAALGVLPADERLDADHPAAGDLDDGLVLEDELAGGDGALEVGRQLGTGHHGLVHRRFEDDHPALAASLGRIHRDVGVAQQVAGASTPGRPAATPTLARTLTSRPSISNNEPIAAVSRWPRHRCLHVRRIAQQHGELVAAEPGGDVATRGGPSRGDRRPRPAARHRRRDRGCR